MEWGRSLMLTVVLQERGASDSREPEPRMGPDRTGRGLGRTGGGETNGEGTWRALLMSRTHREPVNVVMTAGNKADGILVGTEGKYSSMAANFR